MLTIVGIILLLLWLIDYVVHVTAGSLVDLLLIFAAISLALDFFGSRAPAQGRRNGNHRPPKAHRPTANILLRWLRRRIWSLRRPSGHAAQTDPALPSHEQS